MECDHSVSVAEGADLFVGQPARLPKGLQNAELRRLAACATSRSRFRNGNYSRAYSLLSLAGSACLCLTSFMSVASAGDGAVLRKLIDEAIKSEAERVRIPPGTYRLTPTGKPSAHLTFKGVHGLEVDARGVLLTMAKPKHTLVAFRDCSGMRVRGLTIDCESLLFTQGVVAAIEPNGGWYDVHIEDGYPTDLDALGRPRPMSIFDPKTREFKNAVADLYLGGLERRGADTWRAFPVKEVIGRHRFPTSTVQLGDLAAIPFSGGPAITCRGCENMTFEDVTIHHSGNMAFHEHGGGGNTTLRRCRVMRKPGTSRLLSTCADGFHCKNMRRGPLVEECLFEGMHDDGINVHGMFSRVVEPAKGSLVTTAPCFLEWAKPSDGVEFFRSASGDSLGVFKVLSCARLPVAEYREKARKYWPSSGYRLAYRVQLDRPPVVEPGDAMVSLNYVGDGYVIRNNTFRNHRYRAILAKGANGLIEGNQIYGCSNDAISLTPILYSECGFSRNVIVRGNTIRRVGMLPWHRAAIKVSVFGGKTITGREHRNITIENNIIEDPGSNAILVTNASGVAIRNNRISEIGRRRVSSRSPVAIEIRQSEQVSISGNIVVASSSERAVLVIDRSCGGGIVVADNRGLGAVARED